MLKVLSLQPTSTPTAPKQKATPAGGLTVFLRTLDCLDKRWRPANLEALPWKRSSVEVHEDVSQGLHVVSSTLLNAQVGIDTGIASCPGQVLVFPVRDVLPRAIVSELFGKTVVDDENLKLKKPVCYC